jgi:hypothetical protein
MNCLYDSPNPVVFLAGSLTEFSFRIMAISWFVFGARGPSYPSCMCTWSPDGDGQHCPSGIFGYGNLCTRRLACIRRRPIAESFDTALAAS